MSRPLVVVESPAKAKTIARFLGNAFDVRASVGHVADLPSKGLAVDVDNGFKPTYELTERGRQVVQALGPYDPLHRHYPHVNVQHLPGRIIAPGFVDTGAAKTILSE